MKTVVEMTKRLFVPVSSVAINSTVIRQNFRCDGDCDGDCGGGDCDCSGDCGSGDSGGGDCSGGDGGN